MTRKQRKRLRRKVRQLSTTLQVLRSHMNDAQRAAARESEELRRRQDMHREIVHNLSHEARDALNAREERIAVLEKVPRWLRRLFGAA